MCVFGMVMVSRRSLTQTQDYMAHVSAETFISSHVFFINTPQLHNLNPSYLPLYLY